MVQPTEMQLLASDCAEVRSFVESRFPTIEAALRVGTAARRNLILVTADLLYRVIDLALGTGTCLEHKLYSATHAIQRGLVESHVNLMTICRSEDRERLAWEIAAYTRLKRRSLDEETDGDLLDFTLDEVPREIEALTARRVRDRQGWSGLSIKRMMDDLGMDYGIFSWTSEEAHGRGIGSQAAMFRADAEGGLRVRLGRTLGVDSIELIANVSRSLVLSSGSAFWQIVTDEPAPFSTVDPRFSPGGLFPAPIDTSAEDHAANMPAE